MRESDRARTRLWILLIILGAFGLYLLGNGRVSLWDRDEPRYAQTSRQMLQSGDWVVPRLYDEVRTAKPIFIYWCQAVAMTVFGDTAFAARLPSAVAMPITLAVVAIGVWRLAGPRRALWTVLILAGSAMVLVSAKAALTDSVLLLWITVAQGCLYLIWRGRGTWPVVVVLGVAIGLAGLTKGPVVLGVMGMTAVALVVLRWLDNWLASRRADASAGASPVARPADDVSGNEGDASTRGRTPSFLSGVAKAVVVVLIVAAFVAPWLYLVNERAPEFLGTSLKHDVVKRIGKPLEGHGGPPGYHLATIWGTFLPWSILLPLALVLAWQRRHVPQIRFAFAAVVGPWLMFELVRTKLPHYLLPVFPFLAFLAADAVVRCLRGQHKDLVRTQFVIAAGVLGVVAVVGAGGTLFLSLKFEDAAWPALLVMLAAVAYAATFVTLFALRRPAAGLAALGAGMMAVWALMWTVYLPASDPLRLSIRVADVLKRHGATAPGEVVMLDYKEPSLAFYQGGTIREHSATALNESLVAKGPPWMVITKDVWDDPRTSAAAKVRLEVVGSVEGLAYADGGRRVEVMVVKKTPESSETARTERAGSAP